MPQEPQEQTTPTQLPPPDMMTPLDDVEVMQSYAAIASLTTKQTKILIALAQNAMAENIRTDSAIAEECGCIRQYVSLCRRNPKFQVALVTVIKEQIKGNHDKIIQNIYQAGLKDWKAHEFLLKYDGSYTPSSRIQSQNVNINAQLEAPQSPQQAIDTMTERFIRLGYDKPRLLREIEASYDRLTNQ